MSSPSFDCPNCGATSGANSSSCSRCGEVWSSPGTGRPRFSSAARDAGEGLGGLLKLYAAGGERVCYVGWCPAGAMGLDAAGDIVWLEDWGYMASVEVDGTRLALAGKPADLETGRLLSMPSGE